jgi:hypothetical protein
MRKLLLMTFILALPAMAMAKVPKEERQFLKCLRQLAGSPRLDKESMETAITLVDQFKELPTSQSIAACQATLSEIKHQTKRSRMQIKSDYRELLNANRSKSYWFLDELIIPRVECNVYGVKADLALFVGANTSLSAGRCIRTNGTSYAIVAPAIGLIYGYGFSLGVVKQEIESFFEYDLVGNESIGFGEMTSENGDDGRSLGFTLNMGVDVTLSIALIPMGVSYKKMYQRLLDIN